MATQAPPLDEVVGRRPEVILWWMSGEHNLPQPWLHMEERFIHRYFSEQPFFDWTTKNGLLLSHARNNREAFDIVHNRQTFEANLRKNPGIEYMIAGEPQQIPGAPLGEKNGMWVIRKQDRLREPKTSDQHNPYPSTQTLATYYIVGENVYQAPSVADVVGNRVLSAATHLSKFFDKAASLPSFSPTTGHTYLPQQAKPTGTASTAGSPARSREGSVAPGVDSQSLRSGSLAPESQSGGAAASTNAQDARLLAQSLQMAIQFGDEYMDENPILGEPGAFKFTSSTAAVKKRKADEEAAVFAAAKAKERKEAAVSRPISPKPEKAVSPPAVFTEAKAGHSAVEKQKKDEKKRRRKSRPNAQSPTTPASATSATGVSTSLPRDFIIVQTAKAAHQRNLSDQYTMRSTLEAQKRTAKALFHALNTKDIDGIIGVRTPECTHTVKPKTMGAEVRTNGQHGAWLEQAMPLFGGFSMTILREVYDAEKHECAVHVTTKSGAMPVGVGVYESEFMMFLHFTEDGTQITSAVEMVDSAYSLEFLEGVQRWKALRAWVQ
ncbi:hypothetical protein LTR85_008103 [Meristemomyces frigidus]|nr:hypothetical protein LTR85_008103 [Meristemomyces frigidus]